MRNDAEKQTKMLLEKHLAIAQSDAWAAYFANHLVGDSRAVGHWVDVKYDCAACSECGKDIVTPFDSSEQAYYGWGEELYPYCPWCGAKMEPSEFHWKHAPKKGKTKCKCN